MSKKRKGKKTKPQPKRDIKPLLGLLVCAGSLAFFLSLLSFALIPPPHNWLGLIGSSVGWAGHALMGIGSYYFVFFVGWFGWRLCFNKPIHHAALKGLFMLLFLLSLCLILNLVEFRFPSFGSFLRDLFYPSYRGTKLRYHLGGAPLFY